MLDRGKVGSALTKRGSVFISVSGGPVMTGVIVSGYFKKFYRFEDEYDLLRAVEGLCDSMGYPQAEFARRSFGARRKKIRGRTAGVYGEGDAEGIMKENEKATFIVNVMFRKNATFQGSITWVEKERTQRFRSAFEMLKLMDEARSQGPEGTVCWEDPKQEN